MSDTELTFTLQTDQGTLVTSFGPYLPIPVSGTLQEIVNLIANTESSVQGAIDAANTATQQAGIATTQANNAITSASQAQTSANTAITQASTATTQATTATTQAGIATTQAGISSNAATAAQGSATTATTQATTATTQAGIATTQAASATTSAQAALVSQQAAAASESNASTSAATATTQAGIATTQGTTATTQAGIATTQAGNASVSATQAANSAAAAAASAASISLPIPVSSGGTGATTAAGARTALSLDGNSTPSFNGITVNSSTAHGVAIGGGSGSPLQFTAAGTTGQALLSGGASANPAYGTLGIAAGGTGATTASAALTALGAQPTNNPVFTGNVGIPTRSAGDSTDNGASTAFVAAAIAPFSGRNRIINGACTIIQRPSASFGNGAGGYAGPDRFNCSNSAGGAFTQSQSTMTYGGKTYNCVLQQVTSAMTNNSGINFWTGIQQQIEGLNSYDLIGSPLAVSFLFSASLVGNYSVAIRDASGSYSYVTSINVAAANTPQRYVILVPAIPTAANIPRTTAAGLNIWVGALNDATYKTATLNTWQNSNYICASNYVNWAVGSNTIALTLLQLEAGTVATPFEWRSVGHELMLCQRYYEAGSARCYSYENAGTVGALILSFVSWKRVVPTVGVSVTNANNASSIQVYNVFSNSVMIGGTAGGNGPVDFTINYTAYAEL